MFNSYALLILFISVINTKQQQSQPNYYFNTNNILNSNLQNSRNNRLTSCSRGDCYPETGDLLIGRTKFLHASSTCGLTQPERYCVLGTTRDATKCSVCDSTEPYDQYRNNKSHTIDNIVSRKQGDRFNRWWQSENGKQNVYIQFDLEAEFAFTHIIMTFKTFRPAAMIIEKSSNFGRTWKTYGYFASNCLESFPGIPTDIPKNLGELYCETKYSSETPSTKGEAVFRILPPTLIQSRDPYSNEIQDLLKITNLRINFTKLHTFGDNLLDSREELKEKYYYAVYEMVVRGSCLCYGHASKCIPVEGVQYDSDKNGMVHGQCQCQHNTYGTNCEKCEPLFNDRPWLPARSGQTNECKQCQCHNHARTCHFDADIYEQNNFTSGGVCDDCLHNTNGRNCENCKEDFYRDPRLTIDHIATCKPCGCNKLGSINDAKCDPLTNEAQGLIAGKCHCKPLVGGDKCDSCKDGYFNMTLENPDGCESCACNINGTIDNRGCDKLNGLCKCKRFVTGRACDQCMPDYFGLSADNPDGCSPCNCFLGGAYDATCNKTTGQCNCKPNMDTRNCEKPTDGFFCPALDYYIYEAENAKQFDQRTQDYTRSINTDRRKSWTGTGFVRVFEGGSLEFTVDNIFKAGNYELVVRYEHTQVTDSWEDLRVTVIRQDAPTDYACVDYDAQEDNKQASLPITSSNYIVKPPSCLEPNKKYRIKLDFIRLSPNVQGREASILIDSILLIPMVEDLLALQGNDKDILLDEYRYYGCREAQVSVFKENVIPTNCAKYFCNIGIHSDGALPCDCNPTGSLSNLCNPYGGVCQCKPNVIGSKCDRCAPGTWNFGPNGCHPCNCNSAGAKNDLCDLETGQCDCYDRITGMQCSQCQPNSWRFPACEECNCHGNADTCNQTTGHCINCTGHTYGFYCENCEDGYYGRPTAGQSCKECMCPGGIFAGNQFASTCYFDPRIDGVVCNCKEGYIGTRCDKCAINYYGNPLERGGSCKKCECNGNIDINDPNSCDQTNGKCQNCLFNTQGDSCENCKTGYFGNASNHECRPCHCDTYGTENHSGDNCDQVTGQCNCLPNVIGKKCDTCKEDHYGLKSGEGCSDCLCDADGGTVNNSTTCDVHTGQCNCLSSRGGRTCSECSFGYWGDPNIECKECECLATGSISKQCDKINGSCLCRKGIRGYHCDQCERGTTGEVPFCTQCGECFDDWTLTLNNLQDELESLEEKASNIAVGAGSKVQDFSAEYSQLDEKLNDIKKILSLNFTDRQLRLINEKIQNLEKQIQSKKESTKKYYEIENWNTENKSDSLKKTKDAKIQARKETEQLIDQAMNLKESHIKGAQDSILKSASLSDKTEEIVFLAESKLNDEMKPILENLKAKLKMSESGFSNTEANLKDYYENVISNLTNSLSGIFSLNQEVCGELTSESLKCTTKCGGSQCDGRCGTNASECTGVVDYYNNVVNARKRFEELYNKQEQIFKRVLTKLRNSSNLLSNVNKDINQLLDYANKSLQSINMKKKALTELTKSVENFTLTNSQLPKVIESNCDYSANKSIDLNESDLENILKDINELASKINVVEIERNTKDSRLTSQELNKKSTEIFSQIPDLLNDINKTSEMFQAENTKLEKIELDSNDFSSNNQNIIEELNESNTNIDNIRNVINEVQNSINDLKNSVDLDGKDKSSNIVSTQESLKAKVKESNVTLSRTKNSLDNLRTKLDELTKNFESLINNKDNNKGSAEILESLINLQSSILNKRTMLEQKTNKIERLKKQYDETKNRISDLKSMLVSLKDKAVQIKSEIQSKEKFFNSCS